MGTAGHRLGVDFGTSNTVAILLGPDGRTRPLLFDGSPLLPSAVFAGPGTTVATAGHDSTIRLWDVAGRRSAGVLTGHAGAVSGVAFSPDGATLVSSGVDRTVRLWNLASRQTQATFTDHTESVYDVAFGPDGAAIATAGGDETVRVRRLPPTATVTATPTR